MNEVIASVLTILISFAIKWFFALINVEVPEATFNAIVAGIVLWFMTQLGTRVTVMGIRSLRS
jgi:hypothetical protein